MTQKIMLINVTIFAKTTHEGQPFDRLIYQIIVVLMQILNNEFSNKVHKTNLCHIFKHILNHSGDGIFSMLRKCRAEISKKKQEKKPAKNIVRDLIVNKIPSMMSLVFQMLKFFFSMKRDP